jgi:transcriptional regulator with XRE-family HTH domain
MGKDRAPIESSEELREWLSKQMEERGWSMRETSLRSGLSANRINQIMAGDLPGIDACIALAELFDVQLEYVMFLAGYPVKDPRQTFDAEVSAFAEFLQKKPLQQRKMIMRAIRSFLELGDLET